MQNSTSVKDKEKSSSSLKPLFRLLHYVKPYWLEFSAGLFLLLIASVSGLALPKLLGQLIDGGKQGLDSGATTYIGWLLAGILLIQAMFSFFRILFVSM
ncbi:hypothetical protein [Pedobacter sp. NJ-S-72]